uniref:GINS subunit domain-containing protein n=1 Tax=Bionectria ochroleuca TaxID=29856 RepID=A0A8H7N9M9_BIOOC
MDIDDILREVDPTSSGVPNETGDLQSLTRLWVAERSAPELLEWPSGGLFERINDRIKAQIEKIEILTGDMDPKTNFALIVIQTELERYKFLVRSYLRARIAKIDKHTFTIYPARSSEIGCRRPSSPTQRGTRPSSTTTISPPFFPPSPRSCRT